MKTLKDLDLQFCRREGDDCFCVEDFKKELKLEAINWIKAFENKEIIEFNDQEGYNETVQNWIKHFFNILEKDLMAQED